MPAGKKAVFGKKTRWKSLQFPFMSCTENLLNTYTGHDLFAFPIFLFPQA